MSEEANKIVEKTYTDAITGKFKEGNPGGPGRPVGKKNYETEMEEAIIEYAKLNHKTPEEIKLLIYMKGAGEAIKGEYNFYRDFMDRKHGKAKDSLDITTAGQPLYLPSEILNKHQINDTPPKPVNNSEGQS